jgi:hypothetical protein
MESQNSNPVSACNERRLTMHRQSARGARALGTLCALAALAATCQSRASDTVLAGYDLLETVPPTAFGGVPFVGVPLNMFDFGGGPLFVGNTDTIVHRLDPASAPSTAIPIEMLALHLMSAVPADFGLGLGNYFITLQSERGGPATTGRMTIDFGPEPPPGGVHGTFDSFFDVFFDVRLGSLSGPIALSDMLTLTSAGTPWTHEPPPGAVLIDGINNMLNGTDRLNDFHILGAVQETHLTGAMHTARETIEAVPEPGPIAYCMTGALALICVAHRRTKRA